MAELFKSKIHRKCDDNEAYFYDACECFKLVFTFVITSEIDLFSNKTLVQNSIQEWKKLNPRQDNRPRSQYLSNSVFF